MLHRRIAHRMVLRGVHDEAHYLRLLEKESGKWALFRDALIHVTSFRDRAVFQTLQERVLPAIVKHKPLGEPIRFGCPDAQRAKKSIRLRFASLKSCRRTPNGPGSKSTRPTSAKRPSRGRGRGVSEIDQPRGISRALQRFFLPCPGGYQVTKALREACIFARQNVARDPPFARIDLISCRNLLILFRCRRCRRKCCSRCTTR